MRHAAAKVPWRCDLRKHTDFEEQSALAAAQRIVIIFDFFVQFRLLVCHLF
jgi:hypothetical protein